MDSEAMHIILQLRNWRQGYTEGNIIPDLASFLKIQYPSIKFEVKKGKVTLGALIGSTSLEVKAPLNSLMLFELIRDIPGYLCVADHLIILFSEPEEGTLEKLTSFLDENEMNEKIYLVEI